MSAKQELERLLADLVVVWPAEDTNPAVEAARTYLQTRCGIIVRAGEVTYDQDQQENLTDSWFSV